MTKPFRLTRPEPTEAEVMSAVCGALAYHHRVAWFQRFNTGAGKLLRSDGSASQWIRFGFPGCSDLLGQLKDGRFLAVEVKRPSKDTTSEQQAFLATVNANGGIGFRARSADDVFREIQK